MNATFKVRRMSYGVGMERTFALHAPRVEGVTVIRQGSVRQSKLYYLRELSGKKARISDTKRKRLAKGEMIAVVEEQPESRRRRSSRRRSCRHRKRSAD